ncbi:MAG: hypothetical protein SFU98_04725 [Leptospiraceae bacterium]|nr:hypothetical protein [Leptospiraceae bacterium]
MKVLLFLLILSVPIYSAETPPYSKIEPILKETWDKTYPLPFTKIIKKDTLGKGIMVLRDSKKRIYYLYSFLVFFPRYKLDDGKPIFEEDKGREVVVKLYHYPFEKESPYRIDLGEFSEKYNLKSVVRWIK